MKFKNFVYFLILGILLFPIQSIAQRVFAPGEDGKLIEIMEGPNAGKWGLSRKVNLPSYLDKVLRDPLVIYFYFDDEIGNDQIFFCQTRNGKALGSDHFDKKAFKKKYTVEKISSCIYRININTNDLKPINDINDPNVLASFTDKCVIWVEPTKQQKKEGKTEKFWYVQLTNFRYNPRNISKWSNEQALESISQLMEDGSTSIQLFASIKPQAVPSQQTQNTQPQYVIIQNPDQLPNNNSGLTNSQEPQKGKEIGDSDVDKNIPYRDINNENAFALIIANESYSKVASVPFANRDGNKLKEYMKKTLGLSNDHITLLENATLNDMRYELNKLKKISDAYDGDCSFIVYYCGHGIPDEKDGNGYLLPVDGYGNDVSTAYSLSDLYAHLGGLKAKKVVLFTDACFSGAGKEGDMLVEARGIAIKSKPNEATGNLIAFSACQGDETAYSYQEKGHGLLTYYFLKKLQETGGKVTLGELEEYIKDNVGKTAIVINGKSQTPSVSVSPSLQNSWRDQTLYE